MKITARKIKPFAHILLLLAALASWGWTFDFLYKHFYQAMAQTKQIHLLRKNIGLDEINTIKFQETIDKIEERAEIKSNPPEIKNPF